MTKQHRKSSSAIAVFLAFALVQVCVQLSFAAPASTSVVVPQRFVARLTIRGGPSATVNGAGAVSGATVLTGATIETPAATSATLDLGALGTIDLEENSAIQLDFTDDGNVRVKVLRGCVAIKKRGDGVAEVYTAEGASEKTNSNRKGMGFCYANGSLSPLGQVASSAGGGGGLGAEATAAIVIAAIAVPVTLYFALRDDGGNPSPSAP